MGTFVRITAILVGLANLVTIGSLVSTGTLLWTGESSWSEALPQVLAVIVAGLVASEIVSRKFDSSVLAERFADRCGAAIAAMCIGGALVGGLLAITFVVSGELLSGDLVFPAQVSVLLAAAFFTGTLYGAALGFLEGMLLPAPLAAVLGHLKGRDDGG